MSEAPVGVPTCYRHPDRETWIRCQRCERSICPDCMNDAAVGFQCPSCVAEGRKTQRQARTAFGGRPSANPGATSLVLIAINAAVWVLVMVTGGPGSRLVDWLQLRPDGLCLDGDQAFDAPRVVCDAGETALWLPGVVDGAWFQLFTSMFTHVQPMHLGFNMLALWVLGPQIEATVGRLRFLALYLLSGLAGSVAIFWLTDQYTPTVGASGAIFGLMGALVVIGLRRGIQIQGLLVWIGINAVITFVVPNVSWQGHLGGFLGGAVIGLVLAYAPKERRTPVQVAGLAGIGLALVVAAVIRALTLT